MHLSLAFPGVDPRDTPGDLFSQSNKNLLNPQGIGHKIHTKSPSPGAKKPEYLHLHCIFAVITDIFVNFFGSFCSDLDAASMIPTVTPWPLLITLYHEPEEKKMAASAATSFPMYRTADQCRLKPAC